MDTLMFIILALYLAMHYGFSIILFQEVNHRKHLVCILYALLCFAASMGILTAIIYVIEEILRLSHSSLWIYAVIGGTILTAIILSLIFYGVYVIVSQYLSKDSSRKRQGKLRFLQGTLSAGMNLILYMTAVAMMGV